VPAHRQLAVAGLQLHLRAARRDAQQAPRGLDRPGAEPADRCGPQCKPPPRR
jgi:hypothetical protein